MIKNKYNIKILLPSLYATAKAIVFLIDYNKKIIGCSLTVSLRSTLAYAYASIILLLKQRLHPTPQKKKGKK